MIDLDAAMRKGENGDLITRIAKRLPCQVGGGIATAEKAAAVLSAGARRVIVGSALFGGANLVNTEFARSLAAAVGLEQLVFSVDTKQGRVAVKGWKDQVKLTPEEAIPQLEPYCGTFLYTHICLLYTSAIVEVTETGSSLRANRLRIIDTVMESETHLIANRTAYGDPWKKEKIDNICLLYTSRCV